MYFHQTCQGGDLVCEAPTLKHRWKISRILWIFGNFVHASVVSGFFFFKFFLIREQNIPNWGRVIILLKIFLEIGWIKNIFFCQPSIVAEAVESLIKSSTVQATRRFFPGTPLWEEGMGLTAPSKILS